MGEDVLLVSDDAMMGHVPGAGHPERPDRLRAVLDKLRDCPVDGARWAAPDPVTRNALERVHHEGYVDSVDALRGHRVALDADTVVSPGTVDAAYLAAGAAIDVATAVVNGDADRAFALVRPPGHHAEADRAMGFCLFNNIAIAAAHACAALGCQRVLIVDWDVHHGNGTQHAFFDRNDVLLFSAHRYPFYPGTGGFDEVGIGDGAGFTVNVPLPGGFGDPEYLAVFQEVLVPLAATFEPDLVLVSAGFDAHCRDPLGGMAVTDQGFAALCALVRDLADRHASGRLALILEGGYDLAALAGSVHASVEVLAGVAQRSVDPASHAAARVIEQVREVHKRFRSL